MDGSGGLYAKGKLSQTEKGKTILYMWNLKNPATKQNCFYRNREQNGSCQGLGAGRGQ